MKHRVTFIAAFAAFAVLGAAPSARSAFDMELAGTEYSTVPGGVVTVNATLSNHGTETVFISGLSTGISPDFSDSTLYNLFSATGPDSLLPGESWEGPLLELRVAPSAAVSEEEAVLSILGGVHPWAEERLATAWFFVDDSVDVSAAPLHEDGARLAASPNPFRGSLSIEVTLPAAAGINVSVFDVTGRLVRTIHSGSMDPGVHRFTWDGRDSEGGEAGTGIYFLRASGSGHPLRTKVIRIE